MDGTVVNTWTNPVPGYKLSSVEPLDNGNILVYSYLQSSQVNYVVAELDYSGNISAGVRLDAVIPARGCAG